MTRACATTLNDVPAGTSLLGGAFEFCDAFFHVRETPEAKLPLCCVRVPGAAECEGRNTVIVARLVDAQGAQVLVARYHNRSKHAHAEKVMMTDGALRSALRGLRGGGTLTVHISLQPCHHSSSTREISCTRIEEHRTIRSHRSQPADAARLSLTSPRAPLPGTRDLFEWHASELVPKGVVFELVVAYPYRRCERSCEHRCEWEV